jgi:hypothetical protein
MATVGRIVYAVERDDVAQPLRTYVDPITRPRIQRAALDAGGAGGWRDGVRRRSR